MRPEDTIDKNAVSRIAGLLFDPLLSRRRLLLVPSVMLVASFAMQARADTVLRALSENAIVVKYPAQVFLVALAFAGRRLVAAGEHGVIIYSDDNGATWQQAAVPMNGTITALAFANPLRGWAAGDFGAVLITMDGGKTWRIQLNGTEVNQLIMQAAEKFNQTNSGSDAATTALRRANIFTQAGPDKPFLSILVFSPLKVMIFGAYRMAVRTTDGGETWQDISLSIADPISHNIYDADIIGTDIYLAEETGLILKSTDGGQTFSQTTQPADATMFGVLALQSGGVLSYGVAGTVCRSMDSGKTWNQIYIETATNLTAAQALKNGAILLAAQNGQMFISHDNAVTFNALALNIGMEVYDFRQVSDETFLFVGNAGVLSISAAALVV